MDSVDVKQHARMPLHLVLFFSPLLHDTMSVMGDNGAVQSARPLCFLLPCARLAFRPSSPVGAAACCAFDCPAPMDSQRPSNAILLDQADPESKKTGGRCSGVFGSHGDGFPDGTEASGRKAALSKRLRPESRPAREVVRGAELLPCVHMQDGGKPHLGCDACKSLQLAIR